MSGILLLVAASVSATDPDLAHFDCAEAFDLLTTFAAPGCLRSTSGAAAEMSPAQLPEQHAKIGSALDLLVLQDFIAPGELSDIKIEFCPLTLGLGLVATSDKILIDDGLLPGSVETLAEVIFHELIHVRQMRELGSQEFKCRYIRQWIACGGCQDGGHPLEAQAYDAQAQVRDRFLELFEDARR